MQIIKLSPKNFNETLGIAADALKRGKVVVYPTDTSYGLGALVSKPDAIAKVYRIKERGFNKPVHIFVPSTAAAKKYVRWNSIAQKLAKKFLPGPLSIALPLKYKNKTMQKLSAGTGFLGIRIADNDFALRLTKYAGPITATSANPSARLSGGFDSYSAADVIEQFAKKKHKPDLVIDAGRLPKRKPSTFVKVTADRVEFLREGPVSEKEILRALKS